MKLEIGYKKKTKNHKYVEIKQNIPEQPMDLPRYQRGNKKIT